MERSSSSDLQTRMDQLAAAEARVRAVVDTSSTASSPSTSRAWWKVSIRRHSGSLATQAGEVVGQNVKMLMPEPLSDHHDKYFDRYLHTGKAHIIGFGREVEGRRKDGSVFPMDLAVSEFRLDQRRLFVGIARDISERKRSEQHFQFVGRREHGVDHAGGL